jgi:hypothetical protein
MRNPFRRRTWIEKVGGALGLAPRRSPATTTGVRAGLVALGSLAAVTAASAAVSAVRQHQDEGDQDDPA